MSSSTTQDGIHVEGAFHTDISPSNNMSYVAFKRDSHFLTLSEVDGGLQKKLADTLSSEAFKTGAARWILRANETAASDLCTHQAMAHLSTGPAVTEELKETIDNLHKDYPSLKLLSVNLENVTQFVDDVRSSNALLIETNMDLSQAYDSLVAPVDVASQRVWGGKKELNGNQRMNPDSVNGAVVLCHLGKTDDGFKLSMQLNVERMGLAAGDRNWAYNTKHRLRKYWGDVWSDPDVDEASILGALTAAYAFGTTEPLNGHTLNPTSNLMTALQEHLSKADVLDFSLTEEEMDSMERDYCRSGVRRLKYQFRDSRGFPSSTSTQ